MFTGVNPLRTFYILLRWEEFNDEDGKKKVKKSRFKGKTTTSQVHHTFLYISFPFLHHYDVKMPFFDVNKQRRNFISLSQELGKSDLDLKVPYGHGQLQAGVLFPPHRLLLLYFSALLKTREFWSSKVNYCLRCSLSSIILADLSKNRTSL